MPRDPFSQTSPAIATESDKAGDATMVAIARRYGTYANTSASIGMLVRITSVVLATLAACLPTTSFDVYFLLLFILLCTVFAGYQEMARIQRSLFYQEEALAEKSSSSVEDVYISSRYAISSRQSPTADKLVFITWPILMAALICGSYFLKSSTEHKSVQDSSSISKHQ